MSMAISFLSDFGLDDEFVGVVHGVLGRLAPASRVIDVTHGVARGDVRAGSLALLRAVQYLPQGVVLGVVDPGVGTDRLPIAIETEFGFFVGPDNGLLSPAVAVVGGASRAVVIDNPEVRIPSRGATFDGRDVFAPAAALLASGGAKFEDLGSPIDPAVLTPQLLPLPEVSEGSVSGEAWWVDRFGNVETNVSPEDLAAAGIAEGDRVVVTVGSQSREAPWVRAYGDVDEGLPLLHVDSYGMIALAVRSGRADQFFGLGEGTAVRFVKD